MKRHSLRNPPLSIPPDIIAKESHHMVRRSKAGEDVAVLIADSDLIRRQLLARELQRSSLLKIRSCNNDVVSCQHVLSEFSAGVVLWAENSQSVAKQPFAGMREVLAGNSSLRIVVLLELWNRDLVIDAFRSGVRGIFSLEQGSIDALRKCILSVHRDQVWANHEQVLMLIEAFKCSPVVRVANVEGRNLLTPRQQQLVQLVAEGMGNREVAQRLNVTENTVKKSLLRIFDKVGVSNRVELVLSALAFRNQEPNNGAHSATGKSPVSARRLEEDCSTELVRQR
jgi:two-component system nitrate/nitrite response regulator NarL